MKKFLMFILLAAIAVGVVWYESKPTTVTVPMKTHTVATDDGSYYEDTTTTESFETSTTVDEQSDVDFDLPDVTMEVTGLSGDSLRLREVMGAPTKIADLPDEVRAVITGCTGVGDRDMVVQVSTKLELTSALPAKFGINYGTLGHPAVFDYSTGLVCDDGSVSHDLQPKSYGNMTYWVVLSAAITPDYPDGNFDTQSWTIVGPRVLLPNGEDYTWKMWGPRAVNCNQLLSGTAKVWLAGELPIEDGGCQPAATEAQAAGPL